MKKILKALKKMHKSNKRAFTLVAIAIVAIMTLLIGATYAFFSATDGAGARGLFRFTTDTTDDLAFVINKDISLDVSANNFGLNDGDQSDTMRASATLTPNSTNGNATDKYNIFAILDVNEMVYTTENELPEVVIKVTDPNGNVIERITNLTGNDGVFDITSKRGTILIASDYVINASNYTPTTHNWDVEVRMINLDTPQTLNEGKRLHATLYLTKDALNNYELPEVTGVRTYDINGTSTVTENSISLKVDVKDTTTELDKYYYGIEEANTTTGYVENSVVRLSNSKEYGIQRLANTRAVSYLEKDIDTNTFDGLTANKDYHVYAYVIDKLGYRSNVYKTTVKTTNTVAPRIVGVDTSSTLTEISLSVNAEAGTNEIDKYYYSKDNGDTWVEENTNTHTFTGLKDSRTYNIKVKVVDTEGLESTIYYENVATVVYKNPTIKKVNVTTHAGEITLDVIGEKGTANINKYLYTIDSGTNWVEGTSSKTYTSLEVNQEYTILIKAVDVNGNTSDTYQVKAKAGDYILPSISNIEIRPMPTELTINVTAIPGTNEIAKYYYSIHDGQDYQNSTESTMTFSNLSSNTVFYVKVCVEDTNGEKSTVFSKVTKTEYINPSIIRVDKTVTANSATLTIISEVGSNEINNYYYRIKTGNNSYSAWEPNTTNIISLSGLNSNTSYDYEVKAVDTANHESDVTVGHFTTNYVNPIITNLEVIDRTWNTITVKATATAGSHALSKYYFKTDQSSYVESNSDTYTFNNLNDGGNSAVNYEITAYVIDTNYQTEGDNGKSELVKVNTATLVYNLPTLSVTSSKTANTITVNATATKGDGNITKYEYSKDNGTTWEVEHASSALTDSYTFGNLTDYMDYSVKVRVTDANGRTATWTDTIKTNYVEPVITGTSNSVTWNSATITINATGGTGTISKYYFRTSTGSYDSGQTENSKTFNNLTEDTAYIYYVKVEDSNGHFTDEQEVNVRTNDYTEPTLALNGAIQTTYNSVTVNVTGAANETGATIVSYSFKIDSGAPVVKTTSATTSSHTFSVAEGQTHSIEVVLTDSFGRTATVTSTGISTPAYVIPTISSVTPGTTTISSIPITIVSSDGQNTIKGYKVSQDNGSTWGSLISTTSHNYTHTITGLNHNTTYNIKVKAIDTLDRESSVASTSATTAYKEPTVSCSAAAASTNGWGNITVTATGVAGSGTISSYRFKQGSNAYTSSQSGNTYTFGSNGLTPNTTYSFTVEVKDSNNHTATATCSGRTNTYTNVNITNVTANPSYDSASLTVTASNGTGTKTSYEYKLSTASSYTNAGTSASFTIPNLSASTQYSYKVRVKDSNNKYSNEYTVTFTTQAITASIVEYTNSNYTSCTNLKCALDELYAMF